MVWKRLHTQDKEQRVLLSVHLRLGYLPSGYDTAMESIMQYGYAALQPLCVCLGGVRWTEHTHTLTTHHLDHPIHKPSSKLSGLQVRRQPETCKREGARARGSSLS